MRTTTDTHTGKRFRWNETVRVSGLNTPCRSTEHEHVWLDPTRVSHRLLRELNPDERSTRSLLGHPPPRAHDVCYTTCAVPDQRSHMRKRVFTYDPVLLDRMGQATNLEPGAEVVKVQPFGCPPNGTMGQTYVANASDGHFRGMVSLNSLTRTGRTVEYVDPAKRARDEADRKRQEARDKRFAEQRRRMFQVVG